MLLHDSASSADAHAAALRAEIQRHRRPRREETAADPESPPPGGIDLGPASVYEAITRQMVESLRDELREIKSRLNTLLFMVIGAILIEFAMRMIGP
jgi:hypothetical protein